MKSIHETIHVGYTKVIFDSDYINLSWIRAHVPCPIFLYRRNGVAHVIILSLMWHFPKCFIFFLLILIFNRICVVGSLFGGEETWISVVGLGKYLWFLLSISWVNEYSSHTWFWTHHFPRLTKLAKTRPYHVMILSCSPSISRVFLKLPSFVIPRLAEPECEHFH